MSSLAFTVAYCLRSLLFFAWKATFFFEHLALHKKSLSLPFPSYAILEDTQLENFTCLAVPEKTHFSMHFLTLLERS